MSTPDTALLRQALVALNSCETRTYIRVRQTFDERLVNAAIDAIEAHLNLNAERQP